MDENSYGLYLQESMMQVITFLKTPQLEEITEPLTQSNVR